MYLPELLESFSTYATIWIKQAVLRYIDEYGRTIRMPVHVRTNLRKIEKSIRTLESTLGREPTFLEIAQHTNLHNELWVQQMIDLAQNTEVLSLDSIMSDSEPLPTPNQEFLIAHFAEPETKAEDMERAEFVARMLRTLAPKERQVLSLRAGMENDKPMTLQEIGDRLGISRESVRKIELKATQKLRERFSNVAKNYL